jgi:erythronate-4-phosphate dehydrogenase
MNIVADRNLPFVAEAFGPLGELSLIETGDFRPETIRGADALVVRSETKIGPALLDDSRVRFVGTASIGTDHLDLEYLAAHSIAFANAPGCNAHAVKEYVVAALLEAGRRLGLSLRGKMIGIVGAGAVGSKVARAAAALGMNVRLNDPPLLRATGEAKYLPLDALLDADILTLHVPLTKNGPDPTFRLFDAARFARMKRGSLFINSSRGAVAETDALKNALAEGRLRAAVLDVWEGEPAVDAVLLDRALIGTAHVAGYSMEGKVRAVFMVRDAMARHFGLAAARKSEPDLGPAGFPAADIAPDLSSDESILRTAVRAAYDIAFDDRLLRAVRALSDAERPAAFARLRAGYRLRREFTAWSVRLPVERTAAAEVLTALGFKVVFKP